jgi:hypothetical protein
MKPYKTGEIAQKNDLVYKLSYDHSRIGLDLNPIKIYGVVIDMDIRDSGWGYPLVHWTSLHTTSRQLPQLLRLAARAK